MKPGTTNSRHGGRRKGAGRKPVYGERTKPIRVPESQLPVISRYLNALKQPVSLAPKFMDTTLRAVAVKRTATYVPALGRQVAAGKPVSGDNYIEDIVDLGRHLVRNPASTFLMKVSGWSMRDAGIADGDELVVDRDVSADDSHIVVVEVDDELTVKQLKKSGTGWLLRAANPDFDDVIIGSKNDLHVWGVVTSVIHRP